MERRTRIVLESQIRIPKTDKLVCTTSATPGACQQVSILLPQGSGGVGTVVKASLSRHVYGMKKTDATQMKKGHNPLGLRGSTFLKRGWKAVPQSVGPS